MEHVIKSFAFFSKKAKITVKSSSFHNDNMHNKMQAFVLLFEASALDSQKIMRPTVNWTYAFSAYTSQLRVAATTRYFSCEIPTRAIRVLMRTIRQFAEPWERRKHNENMSTLIFFVVRLNERSSFRAESLPDRNCDICIYVRNHFMIFYTLMD